MVVNFPATREEARALGSVSYFTGEPCKKGHIEKRYTNTGICYECKRGQAKRDYQEHPDRIIDNAYAWAQRNPEKCFQSKKKWRDTNREAYREMCRITQRNKRLNPLYRLSQSASRMIAMSIRKGGRHWEELVHFTLAELQKHLESKFRDGMTWENYGTHWEIDHIRPRSECTSFAEMWELKNLQPLLQFENRSKGNRKTWRKR